jgi:3-oxoacyl-[acyl-carrier-protein] synthase III
MLTALRVAKAKFAADARRNVALVAVQQRASDLIDLSAAKDRWLWPMGDGGAAVVVRRTGPGIVPLGHAFAHEGRASKQLSTRFDIVDEGPAPQDFFVHEWAQQKYITLRDADVWYPDFRDRALRRLPEVIQLAVQRSGLRLDDIALVQAGFLYPEIADGVADALGVGKRFQRHNAHGLLNGAELGFVLQALRADAGLRGKHVVLACAALPASYGAMVLRMDGSAGEHA